MDTFAFVSFFIEGMDTFYTYTTEIFIFQWGQSTSLKNLYLKDSILTKVQKTIKLNEFVLKAKL